MTKWWEYECVWGGGGLRKTREVIYDAVEIEAVRGSWLCTYWLLQVSEFICYASSIAGLLPEGHTAVIQRAASTSGACRGERESDRFGEDGEEREGMREGRWGCRRIESVRGGGGVCVCGIKTKGEAKERQIEVVEFRELGTGKGEKKGEEDRNINSFQKT